MQVTVTVGNHSKAMTFIVLTGEKDQAHPLFQTSQRFYIKEAKPRYFYFLFKEQA
jgi:hypothetical protein